MPYYAPPSYGANAPNFNLGTTDPRKIASGTRQSIYQQGQQLSAQDQALADRYAGRAQQTQDYLGGIESPLAQGRGGYNAAELSQIEMTPEQQQRMVTGAGISAGAATEAGVNAAQRAAAAAGGNPLAMGAYRARAAQQAGSQAGDAMTQARIGASNAAAQRAETIGQTRIGQQNQALGYYGGLQAQQTSEAEQARQRQQQEYATQTGGMNEAAKTGVSASQTPSTFDKIMGGIGGAMSSLEEGDVPSRATPAVVGENGPEKVVQMKRSYLDDGDVIAGDLPQAPDYQPGINAPDLVPANLPQAPDYQPGVNAPTPWWSRLASKLKSTPGQQPHAAPNTQDNRPWSPVDTYSTIGKMAGQGIGKLAGFLEDGGVATSMDIPQSLRNPKPGFGQMPSDIGPPQGTNGIFTRPTRVNLNPGEAVVPLNYRAGAKVRPRFAGLPAAHIHRHPYHARV